MVDESRILRQRVESLRDRADRLVVGSPGTDVMVGQVYNGGAGIPTTVPNQFAVHPVTVAGQECEGCTPTVTADASSKTIFTVLGGGKVPVAGDNLVARVVGGRWVADRIKVVTQTANCTICVVLSPCVGDKSGFNVNLVKGTLLNANQTSGADGKACFPIGLSGLQSSGTYNYTVTRSGWPSQSGTISVASGACTGGATINSQAVYVNQAPTGYNCCYTGNVQDFSQGGIFVHDICYNTPIPNTLILSDGLGSVTLGMSAITGSSCMWEGCAMRTTQEAITTCSPYDTNNIVHGVDVPVLFQLAGTAITNGTGNFTVTLTVPGCSSTAFPGMPHDFAVSGYTCATMNQHTGIGRGGPTGPVSSCSPFSWSASIATDSNDPSWYPFIGIYGGSIGMSASA